MFHVVSGSRWRRSAGLCGLLAWKVSRYRATLGGTLRAFARAAPCVPDEPPQSLCFARESFAVYHPTHHAHMAYKQNKHHSTYNIDHWSPSHDRIKCDHVMSAYKHKIPSVAGIFRGSDVRSSTIQRSPAIPCDLIRIPAIRPCLHPSANPASRQDGT